MSCEDANYDSDYDLLDYYCEQPVEYEEYTKRFEEPSRCVRRDKRELKALNISVLNQRNIQKYRELLKRRRA